MTQAYKDAAVPPTVTAAAATTAAAAEDGAAADTAGDVSTVVQKASDAATGRADAGSRQQ
jgi:hypothetical protein